MKRTDEQTTEREQKLAEVAPASTHNGAHRRGGEAAPISAPLVDGAAHAPSRETTSAPPSVTSTDVPTQATRVTDQEFPRETAPTGVAETRLSPASGRRQAVMTIAVVVGLALAAFVLTRPARSEQETPASGTSTGAIQAEPAGKQVAGIETGPVTTARLDESISTTGVVSFPSDSTVKISPRLAGRIRQVFVHVGDRVAAGQTLAILDSVDAASAQSAFAQSKAAQNQAALNLARQEGLYRLGTPDVTAAEAVYNQAKAGTAAAQVVLNLARHQAQIGGFTQKPLEDAENALVSATSSLSQARADLALAQKDYDRKKKLLAIGVVAQTDVEQSEDAYDKARASAQAGEESVRLAQQAVDRERSAFKSNLYADQTIRQDEAAYRQAVLQEAAALRALQIARAQIRRDLEQARTDYRTAAFAAENAAHALTLLGHPGADGSLAITAPGSGVVTERDVNPGQVVDQSQETPWQMFVISNPDTVWVDADVHEADIAAVRKGAAVTIAVAGAPGRTFDGQVVNIAPTLDRTSHTVKVRSVIPNRSGALIDGMYAGVTIHAPAGRRTCVIPLDAISHEQDADYVYVARGDTYARRVVKLGATRGDKVVVTEGLKPQEQIVIHGALFLGSRVSDE